MIRGFEFRRFKPSADVAIHANAALLGMLDFVAGGDIKEATLARRGGKFVCSLEVRAHGLDFYEDKTSADPKAAVDAAWGGLKEKLMQWQYEHLAVDNPTFWNFKEVNGESLAKR